MSGWAAKPKEKEPLPDTSVWATYQFPALHFWPGAPDSRRYLGTPHRHLFHARVEIIVTHDDRDIEFHDLRDVVAGACLALGEMRTISGTFGMVTAQLQDLGAMSCEMIARRILASVQERWPGRPTAVDVSEDGEFGATVTAE